MKKFNYVLNEEEKSRILNLHKIEKNTISEQKTPDPFAKGPIYTFQPDIIKFSTSNVNTAGSNLFKTGSAEINTDSPEFKNAVSELRNATFGSTIEVQGGASRVGEKQGFDNKGLAKKRAENFVKALQDAGLDKYKYKIIAPVVGGSDVRDSKEALAAQFVKYGYNQLKMNYDYETAIDNTGVKIDRTIKDNPLVVVPPIPKPDPVQKELYSIKYEITYDPKVFPSKRISAAIAAALQGKVVSIKGIK